MYVFTLYCIMTIILAIIKSDIKHFVIVLSDCRWNYETMAVQTSTKAQQSYVIAPKHQLPKYV